MSLPKLTQAKENISQAEVTPQHISAGNSRFYSLTYINLRTASLSGKSLERILLQLYHNY